MISANLGVWFTRIGRSQDAKKHGEIKSNHKKCTTSLAKPCRSQRDWGWPVRMLQLTWLSEEGNKILGVWRWSPRYCSAMMEGFVVGAAPVSCTTPRLKQDKRDNVNLSGILIESPIHDIKYITTKC